MEWLYNWLGLETIGPLRILWPEREELNRAAGALAERVDDRFSHLLQSGESEPLYDATDILCVLFHEPFLIKFARDFLLEQFTHEDYREFLTTIALLYRLYSGRRNSNADAALQLKAVQRALSPGEFRLSRSNMQDFVSGYSESPQATRVRELQQIITLILFSGVVEVVKNGYPLSETVISVSDVPPKGYEPLHNIAVAHYHGRPKKVKNLAMEMYFDIREAVEGRESASCNDDEVSIKEKVRELQRDWQAIEKYNPTHGFSVWGKKGAMGGKKS